MAALRGGAGSGCWPCASRSFSLAAIMELTTAVLGSIGYGLISPSIFIPALAVGWFVQRWWHVAVGSVVIAVISLVWWLTEEMPEGAQMIWPATPVGLIPPFVWCAAGFLARNWYRRHAVVSRQGFAISLIRIAIGILVGGIGGGVLGGIIGMAYVALERVSSFEGLSGYVVASFMLIGITIGIVGGGLVGFLRGRVELRTRST
jgi:hypothetical protein